MPIVFGGNVGIKEDSFSGFLDKLSEEFSKVTNSLSNRMPKSENVYVDSGFSNVPGTAFVGSNVSSLNDIKTRRIVTQEPQATVYVKKRAFWSLRNEYDTRFMDSGEKLFVRASKMLFENKCTQISAYEGITKVSRLVSEDAHLDATRIDAIIDYLDSSYNSSIDSLEAQSLFLIQSSPALTDLVIEQLNRAKTQFNSLNAAANGLSKISKSQKKLNGATTTNWVVDNDNIKDISNTGRGVGVIELTCVTEVNTDLSFDGEGSITFTVEDPYNLCKISGDDIEMSLNSAYAEMNSNTVYNLGPTAILESAKEKDEILKKIRRDRLSGGNFLSGSAVGDIVFEINGSALSNDKVVGSISSLSEPFNRNNFRMVFNELPSEQKLTAEEDNLVVSIFELLDSYVKEVERITSAKKASNEDPNVVYARSNLRKFYLGKSIIQPMDGVHVYLRSKTEQDSAMIGPVSYLLNNTSFIRLFENEQEVSGELLKEEMRQFGISDIDIPLDLYKTLRTGSFMRNAGMHVFGGLVSSVTESYNAERGYSLSIAGSSNMKWLNMSRINTTPSLDQTQSVLEDPLTPFDIKVDAGTGIIQPEPKLLKDNLDRINNGSGIFFRTGDLEGQKVTEENIKQDFSKNSTTIQHTPGLAYKWKSGIITATLDANLRTALGSSESNLASLRRETGQTITQNPFANMDPADIISTLVTGFPHNYESFVDSTRPIGTYVFGGGDNSSKGFFNSALDILESTNKALGNFQPFKLINTSPDKMQQRLNIQSGLQKDLLELNRLRGELAAQLDELNSLGSPPTDAVVDTQNATPEQIEASRVNRVIKIAFSEKNSRIKNIQTKINEKQTALNSSIANAPSGLRIYGTDASLEIENTETEDERNTSVLRNRIKNELLQMRSQLRCKFNEDVNLFIVSDDYDKDLDVQAFILNLNSGSPPLWGTNSDYQVPGEICQSVAKTMDMEFFVDSQGHIQFRTPKYNKTPLSLLLKMLLLKDKDSIQIYPTALESLFASKLTSLRDQAQTVNLQIQIETILLGSPPNTLINGQGDLQQVDENKFIDVGLFFGTQANIGSDVSNSNLPELLLKTRNDLKVMIGGNKIEINDEAKKAAADEISQNNDPKNPSMNVNRLNRINNISKLVSEKQKINDTIKKMESQDGQFGQFDITRLRGSPISKQTIKNILTVFGDLIEDDCNDFLGPGSASRYIINDDKIINSRFTESDQNVFCRVDVNGGQNFMGEGFGVFAGIPTIKAGGTDFDLWRQYGYKAYGPIDKPFFKDGTTQCAPYAQMLLTRAKREAVRGEITVAGNEYYQLGDVVYVNYRELLYYVTGVKHTFSYSGGYTTTLELKMGHPVGEFIPTPMDIIGKVLIKNQSQFNKTRTYRQSFDRNVGVVLGTIKFNPNAFDPTEEQEFSGMLSGGFYKHNVAQLKNALLIAKQHINSTVIKTYPKIEIRGFFTEERTKSLALLRMGIVRDWLKNPVVIEGGETIQLSVVDFPPFVNNNFEQFTDSDPVNIDEINETNYFRVPSDKTISISETPSKSDVVEIVLVFKPRPVQE